MKRLMHCSNEHLYSISSSCTNDGAAMPSAFTVLRAPASSTTATALTRKQKDRPKAVSGVRSGS